MHEILEALKEVDAAAWSLQSWAEDYFGNLPTELDASLNVLFDAIGRVEQTVRQET